MKWEEVGHQPFSYIFLQGGGGHTGTKFDLCNKWTTPYDRN